MAHQSGMEAHGAIAHVAFNLLLRRECCDGVDNDDVDGCRADELIGNLECLFAVVGLRNQKAVHVDTQLLCIEAVEGMLGIDECCDATLLLCFGDGMDGERGLTTRLRSVDLDDASLRISAYAECGIQSDGARGDDLHVLYVLVAHAHDATLAEVLFYFR